jgi:hypothetical protein
MAALEKLEEVLRGANDYPDPEEQAASGCRGISREANISGDPR